MHAHIPLVNLSCPSPVTMGGFGRLIPLKQSSKPPEIEI